MYEFEPTINEIYYFHIRGYGSSHGNYVLKITCSDTLSPVSITTQPPTKSPTDNSPTNPTISPTTDTPTSVPTSNPTETPITNAPTEIPTEIPTGTPTASIFFVMDEQLIQTSNSGSNITVCFDINETCYNPNIIMDYRSIDYDSGSYADEYLHINYNETIFDCADYVFQDCNAINQCGPYPLNNNILNINQSLCIDIIIGNEVDALCYFQANQLVLDSNVTLLCNNTQRTSSPSISPTLVPITTLDPTINPTQNSSISPSITPSLSPTMEPTSNETLPSQTNPLKPNIYFVFAINLYLMMF